jgi:hypothetical protein
MGPASPDFPSYSTVLFSYTAASGESVELPALTEDTDYEIKGAVAGIDTLFFVVTNQMEVSQTLYSRPPNASTDASHEIMKASEINWLTCGDMLYYVAWQAAGGSTLYSLPLDDAGADSTKLLDAASIQLLQCGV